MGRGYDDKISYFEVYNERDFSSGGNETWGVKYHPASLLLSATKANSGFQNIGM